MSDMNISHLISEFLSTYETTAKDNHWQKLSQKFKEFWYGKVMQENNQLISEYECDEIIRILDRNGRGNTKENESVAKAMVAQGAWQRMLNLFHSNKDYGQVITSILEEQDQSKKAGLIDTLYKMNEGKANFVTGPSGNVICAFLAAYDPVNNLSVISLKDRRAIIDFLELKIPFDWDTATIGKRIVETNNLLIEGFSKLGLNGSARTVACFCYFDPMKTLWKGQHAVNGPNGPIIVTVPTELDDEVEGESGQLSSEVLRESFQMQALLAEIGVKMGFTIWLPKSDRGRILTAWKPKQGDLIESLPLGYDSATIKTIEQIDVIWLNKRSIARAFEVEHTTSVYSGLLRMADLVALQPNINIRLHIVAPTVKREKVMQEIQRPVFSRLEGRSLSEMCTYLSYESITAIREIPHLAYTSDKVIEEYEERADQEDFL